MEQVISSVKRSPLHNRAASVFIHTEDLRKSAEWYSRLLGLPVDEKKLTSGGPVYWFDLPGTGLILDNNSGNRSNPEWREEMKPFVMLACDDIDEAYTYVLQKGTPISEPERHQGMAYFNFNAPDGRVYMACWSASGGTEHPLPESSGPIIPTIGQVFVNTRDMQGTADWISDLLGVPFRPDDAEQAIYTVPTSRGAALLLDDNRARRSESFEILFSWKTRDVEAAFRYVEELGLEVFHAIERHGDVAFFTLADPDGNLVMVCQSGEAASKAAVEDAELEPVVETVEVEAFRVLAVRTPTTADKSGTRTAWRQLTDAIPLDDPRWADLSTVYVFIPQAQWATGVQELWVGLAVKDNVGGMPEGIELLEFPASLCARVRVHGDEAQMNRAYGSLFRWLQESEVFKLDDRQGVLGIEANRVLPVNPLTIPYEEVRLFDYEMLYPIRRRNQG